MKNNWRAVLAVALALALSSPALTADRERASVIPVEDIGTKVTLVGRLGEPLGKMMEVKGTWVYPDARVKDFSLRFRVSHVNGKRLPKLVEFNVAQLQVVTPKGKNAIPKFEEHKTLEGRTWTLRAYETGRFHSVPEDFWKELGTAAPARPYWQKTFTSELVGVVQR